MAGADASNRYSVSEWGGTQDLILDPDVGVAVARAFGDFLGCLESVHDMAERTAVVDGFGPFRSGRALREKFARKASGTPGSIDVVLREHIETVRLLAHTVAVSLMSTSEADRTLGQRITGVVR
ncbi:hypothetical protein [Nocardia paucivorans]|uniref:hypothetical protein n=1 Tax=Nocardia paucivorans TaxID=114259 RepID=UPI0002E41EE0|nr:hypothetical protein [Nocardia paucivorans]